MEKTKVRVLFSIKGETFNPEDITARLGIQPTDVHPVMKMVKGENGKKVAKKVASCWVFSTEREESMDANIQLARVVDVFKNKAQLLKELKHEFKLRYTIMIVVVMKDRQPAMRLKDWLIDFVHNIGAEIDFDIYV